MTDGLFDPTSRSACLVVDPGPGELTTNNVIEIRREDCYRVEFLAKKLDMKSCYNQSFSRVEVRIVLHTESEDSTTKWSD